MSYTNRDKSEKDSYETPQYLFNWLDSIFYFDVDLACTQENKKCGFGINEDSLNKHWTSQGSREFKFGFLNPPYSDLSPWLEKAINERTYGFTTVMVIPSHNGERWNSLAKQCDYDCMLNQRVAFVDSVTKIPAKGNNRGTMVCVFSPNKVRLLPEMASCDQIKIYENWMRKSNPTLCR